jgi:hypothetical protein
LLSNFLGLLQRSTLERTNSGFRSSGFNEHDVDRFPPLAEDVVLSHGAIKQSFGAQSQVRASGGLFLRGFGKRGADEGDDGLSVTLRIDGSAPPCRRDTSGW